MLFAALIALLRFVPQQTRDELIETVGFAFLRRVDNDPVSQPFVVLTILYLAPRRKL